MKKRKQVEDVLLLHLEISLDASDLVDEVDAISTFDQKSRNLYKFLVISLGHQTVKSIL